MAEINIAQPMRFRVDVRSGLVEQPQRGSLMRGDKRANRIIVELVDGAGTFDITGVEVKGKFCRPPDMDEIDLTGTAEGNVAIVELSDPCYANGGHYEARVILVLGGVERTVLFISGDVLKSGSGNAAGEGEGGGGGNSGSGLPSGGTSGQVLVKVSSAEGAAIWRTLTAADVGALPADGKAVDADKLNGKDAAYYIQPRNLLDNSDFTNPVNQRGNTTITGDWTYGIDRWMVSTEYDLNPDGSILITDNGLSIGYWTEMFQLIPFNQIKGKTLTFAVCTENVVRAYTMTLPESAPPVGDGGTYFGVGIWDDYVVMETIKFDNSDGVVFRFRNAQTSNQLVYWAALYEGEYTADNLPPYVPKGYAAELMECQRYFRKLGPAPSEFMVLSGHVTSSGTTILVELPFVLDMRVKPSLTASCSLQIRGIAGYATEATASSTLTNAVFTLMPTTDGKVGLMSIKKADGTAFGNLTNNTPVTVQFQGSSVLEFSADL